MKKDLTQQIVKATGKEISNLRTTLSKIKKRHDLRSVDQAACYYIKKNKLNINVSSIIDEITRAAVQPIGHPSPSFSLNTTNPRSQKRRSITFPKIKWIATTFYPFAESLANLYGYLFLFENALRLKIHEIMKAIDNNWWETKIKAELHDVYKYAADEKASQATLPMIGSLNVSDPLVYITLGHLEQIVVKYQREFVPSLFPNLHFFTGHMVIIKRVRNSIAHMSPYIKPKDFQNAKSEINILLQHLSTK